MDDQEILETVGEEAFSLLTQFYQYDRNVPLDARVYDREESDYSIREKVVFRGLRESLVPGLMAVPASISPPYPCVLLMHGLGASKEDWWKEGSDEDRLAKELLSTGFAVFALDIEYHGERTHNSSYESAWSMVVEQGRVNCYREMLVQSAGDCRRALDYLLSRSDMAPNRIGFFGRSVGGVITYILTAIDSRIRVAIASATCPMSDYYVNRLGWGASGKELLAPVAPRNFAPAITQAAFLMMNGRNDTWGTEEGIRALHELIRSPNTELIFFNSGHRLPSEFVSKAVDWFRRYLPSEPITAA